MNREIIFRGQVLRTGEWIYGNLLPVITEQGNKGFFIIVENTSKTDESIPDNSICFEHGKDCFYVDPDTIGQYTGVKDKNGTMIFEGDLLNPGVFDYFDNDKGYKFEVKWLGTGFYAVNTDNTVWVLDWLLYRYEEAEVIGNIYNNNNKC